MILRIIKLLNEVEYDAKNYADLGCYPLWPLFLLFALTHYGNSPLLLWQQTDRDAPHTLRFLHGQKHCSMADGRPITTRLHWPIRCNKRQTDKIQLTWTLLVTFAQVVETSVTVNNNVNRVLSGPGNATWVQTFPRPYSVIGMNFSVTFLISTISFGRLRFLFLISACNFCSLHYLLNENKKVNSNYSL